MDSRHRVVWQRCCSADRPSGRDSDPCDTPSTWNYNSREREIRVQN